MKISSIRWKALIGLAAVWTAIAMNLEWIWGIIFIIWVIPEIKHGVAYFLEDVERSRNPITYWIIIASWIAMSLYILVTVISPKLNPESSEFFAYQKSEKNISMATGEYVPKSETPMPQKAQSLIPITQDTIKQQEQDTLSYKLYNADEMFFVGISTHTTYQNNQYESDIKELWNYFYENDISYVIPNIIENKIYVIYSSYNQVAQDYFKITIAYKTEDTSSVYKGLEGIHIPPKRFAVIASQDSSDMAMSNLWSDVWNSNLDRANDFDLEVYALDHQLKISERELFISLKNQ